MVATMEMLVSKLAESIDQDGHYKGAGALALGDLGKHPNEEVETLKGLLHEGTEKPAVTALTIGGARPRAPVACRKTKCAAAVALGHIARTNPGIHNWDELAGEVARLLDDDDWEVRVCGLEVIAEMGPLARHQSAKVINRLDDETAAVRAKAAYAVGQIREPEGVQGLVDQLKDGSPMVREQAALALARLEGEGEEFVDKVFEHLLDPKPAVRAAVCMALGLMGDRGQYYAGVVAQRLQVHDEAIVRVAALKTLGNMEVRGSAYSDVVQDSLRDADPAVRDAARECLNKFQMLSDSFRDDRPKALGS